MKYGEIMVRALAQVTDYPESFWRRIFVEAIISGSPDAELWLTEEPDETAEAAIAYAVAHKEQMLAPIEAGLRKAYENDVSRKASSEAAPKRKEV